MSAQNVDRADPNEEVKFTDWFGLLSLLRKKRPNTQIVSICFGLNFDSEWPSTFTRRKIV